MAAGAVLCSVHEHPHVQEAGGQVGGGGESKMTVARMRIKLGIKKVILFR